MEIIGIVSALKSNKRNFVIRTSVRNLIVQKLRNFMCNIIHTICKIAFFVIRNNYIFRIWNNNINQQIDILLSSITSYIIATVQRQSYICFVVYLNVWQMWLWIDVNISAFINVLILINKFIHSTNSFYLCVIKFISVWRF